MVLGYLENYQGFSDTSAYPHHIDHHAGIGDEGITLIDITGASLPDHATSALINSITVSNQEGVPATVIFADYGDGPGVPIMVLNLAAGASFTLPPFNTTDRGLEAFLSVPAVGSGIDYTVTYALL